MLVKMIPFRRILPWLFWALVVNIIQVALALQTPLAQGSPSQMNHGISEDLFNELEEYSRIVDIAYCVGLAGTGIRKPFSCLSRCDNFKDFKLVTSWNTGPFFSDSCGYIALSHPPSSPRIIIAFRGTYSITNTIIDLSTLPQKYEPYDGESKDCENSDSNPGAPKPISTDKRKCENCNVHSGFMTSWRHTRRYIVPHLAKLIKRHPDYRLTLVGHSLGGAVAALAALEFQARGWNPQVITFGEPRIGNLALVNYINESFPTNPDQNTNASYRRITHVNDPVPLLPLQEWGYRMHAGEIFISKPSLPPLAADIYHCQGNEDLNCIAGSDTNGLDLASFSAYAELDLDSFKSWWRHHRDFLSIPSRFRIWQLLFAHRDYFWRLGVCLPGGDPADWFRKYSDVEFSKL